MPWPAEAMPEVRYPAHNGPDAARAALGRVLFYDPLLSLDGETACATCHSELWGMGDGLPLAIGAGAGSLSGPGRSGERVGRRNAQTLWNVAFQRRLFWDGRAASLEEQALQPLDNERELALPLDDAVAALGALPEYRALFADAFADDAGDDDIAGRAGSEVVSADRLARALASFERTLISRAAPYDAYVAGDLGALSEAMVQGMELFAEVGCVDCHAPPLFGGDRFADRGVGDTDADRGRAEVSGDDGDAGMFRVPTLRNARETFPYFHDGSVDELADAIDHELQQQARLGFRALEAGERRALTEFVSKALVDLSSEPDRPEAVPSGLPVPLDGFRIPR